MGRKRKEGLIEVALSADWQTSVAISVGILLFGFWVVPSFFSHNPYLKAVAHGIQPVVFILSGVFGIIALIKYLGQRRESSRIPSVEELRSQALVPNEPELREAEATVEAGTPAAWSIELIQTIEWKRFEDVCQKFYELKGIRSECTPLGPDGGIDIRLYQDANQPVLPTAIVQCKAWGNSFVGVKPIRELLGVMVHEKIGKAFFMTSGSYSDEAKAFAAPNRITLIDGKMLLAMFNRLANEQRQSLFALATRGDYNIPTCPSCGTKMRLIPGKEGRRDFWGCGNYPKCRQKLGARKGANIVTAYYE